LSTSKNFISLSGGSQKFYKIYGLATKPLSVKIIGDPSAVTIDYNAKKH
jgi:alpha-L-fucosidase